MAIVPIHEQTLDAYEYILLLLYSSTGEGVLFSAVARVAATRLQSIVYTDSYRNSSSSVWMYFFACAFAFKVYIYDMCYRYASSDEASYRTAHPLLL